MTEFKYDQGCEERGNCVFPALFTLLGACLVAAAGSYFLALCSLAILSFMRVLRISPPRRPISA